MLVIVKLNKNDLSHKNCFNQLNSTTALNLARKIIIVLICLDIFETKTQWQKKSKKYESEPLHNHGFNKNG